MHYRIDQLLLLEHLTYLPGIPPLPNILTCRGLTVEELLIRIDLHQLDADKDYGSYLTGRDWQNILTALKQDESLTASRILDVHIDTRQGGGGGISLVLLNSASNEAVIAFRGTAPAEWADDFAGANVEATAQQENALLWYRQVYDRLGLENCFVTVIGHSKGGNKAKYITVLDDTPDRCVSFDGQGFSDKFFDAYADRIRLRQPVIENHNVDYDYVNILLNDIGKRYYYRGFDYGRGGLAESHCPNTFFNFAPDGSYTLSLNPDGQSPEMQELDRFLNSYIRSMPSDQETTEAAQLMGLLVERAFNLKHTGDSLTDYINFLCEMVSSDTYNDNVAFLFAFFIRYDRLHPGFTDHITRVLEYFDMQGFVRYIRMVQSLLQFPGLNHLISIADFFAGRLPEAAYISLRNYIRDRFDVFLTQEQLKGMLQIIRMLREALDEIRIEDDGEDRTIE